MERTSVREEDTGDPVKYKLRTRVTDLKNLGEDVIEKKNNNNLSVYYLLFVYLSNIIKKYIQ